MSVATPRRPDFFGNGFLPPAPEDIPTITILPYALVSGEGLVRETRSSTDGPVAFSTDPHFRYDGAMALPGLVAGIPLSFVGPDLLTGGAAQAARYQLRVQTITSPTDRVKLRLRPGATTLSSRFKVNGCWITRENIRETGLTAGGTYMAQLDFATAASRLIEFENSGSVGFGGMAAKLGVTFTRPAEPAVPIRLAILGDSYTGGAGSPPDGTGRMETWCNYVARLLGATSYINFGIGGTGWLTTNPFSERVPDIIAFNPTHVIILGSRNDGTNPAGLQAEVESVLADLATVKNVYVSGPSTSSYTPANAQIAAACAAAGRPFLDGIAGAWITTADLGTDGVHPTFDGHYKLGRGILKAIKAAGEVPDVYVPTPTIADDFNRADVTTALGTTPVGGATWGTAGTPTSGIASNRLYVSTGSTAIGYRNLPGDGPTGTWEIDVPVVGASKAPRFVFNYIDGTNHMRVYGDGTNWKLQTRTTAGGNVDTALSVAVANGDHIAVTRDAANLLTIKINGATVLSTTTTANATGSTFGVAGNNANTDTRYDNIAYTPLAP